MPMRCGSREYGLGGVVVVKNKTGRKWIMAVSGRDSLSLKDELCTTDDKGRQPPQGREVVALSTCGEPPTIQTEFLKPPRLSEATTSSSSRMLSRTFSTARSARNAHPCRSPLSSESCSLSGRLPNCPMLVSQGWATPKRSPFRHRPV